MGPNSAIVTGPVFTSGEKHGSKGSKKINPVKSNITVFGLSPKHMNNFMRTPVKEY